jgi:hypothetical protein
MEDVCIFYNHCVYFTAISYILWPSWHIKYIVFWYIFPCLGMLYQEQSGNPALDSALLH